MVAVATPEPLLTAMSALADNARLRLLALLEREELGVGELAQILQLPQSTVSRHLKTLTDGGYVESRGSGTRNLHRLAASLDPRERRLWELARDEIVGWAELEHDELRLREHLAARARADSVFADVAGDWETVRAELYGELFTGIALQALIPPDFVVADLGCGSGVASAQLAPHVARVVAVDSSPEMLAAARERLRGVGNVEIRDGDLATLPIDDRACDAGLSLVTLSHLADVAAMLAEAHRIMRPGGRLVVVDLLRHERDDFQRRMAQVRPGFTPDELREFMSDAGFVRVAIRPLPPEPAAKGPALLLATGERRREET